MVWQTQGPEIRRVKLIASIPLHVYHLDPGNYHAKGLPPISRQMPPAWKQMGEEQDGDGMSWLSLGQSPGEGRDGSQGCCRLCPMALQCSTGRNTHLRGQL